LAELAVPRPVRTLYLGGGTPSHLPVKQLAALLETVGRWFPLEAEYEFTAEANPADFPSTWYSDASLNQIYFLDDLQGFAIGDRGIIWRTGNSGRTWEQQPSGTSHQLRDITFLDDQTGWIVGGDVQPYSQESVGVVLKTTDAGHTWHQLPMQALPLLKAIRFEDARRGYALAQPSALYPSGLIETTDGGRSWRPMPHVQPRA
jgi:photosystem II stability/assembly factor-like uncharacterized protein